MLLRNLLFFILFYSNSNYALGQNIIKILAFGDSGTGSQTQMNVAKTMQKVCLKDGCDFAILLGDNFYDNGVGHVDDKQFIDKFERPYGPLAIPFYASLGNHDDRGDTLAQVEYTQKSQWWKMPQTFYEKRIGDVHLIAIDSNDFDTKQKEFVLQTLTNSDAKWKVVFGHHPIYSYGMHGNTGLLEDELLPILCQYGSIYVAGHDHDLQVLQAECGLPLVVSGAAAKLRNTKKGPRSLWAASQLGFARLELAENSLSIIMYDEKGEIIHESSFARREQNTPTGYYKAINKQKDVRCNFAEVITGFRLDHSGDEHAEGFYCKREKDDSEPSALTYVEVDDLSGTEYDVSCSDSDQAVVGVTYNSGLDDHILGLYCRQRLIPAKKDTPYYLKIDGKGLKESDIHCQNPEEAVIGVKYKDFGDDYILGIYCQ